MPEEYLGDTLSLCPVCLKRLPARRVAAGDEVRLERTCPEHGVFSVPVWRGEPSMTGWQRPKKPSQPNPDGVTNLGCPFDCGLCPEHTQHTCTALVEITGRCDLGCPVCFASSLSDEADGTDGTDATPAMAGRTQPSGSDEPGLDELARRFRELKAKAGSCNIQLSGGEPTVRPDLPDIISAAVQSGFAFVQLNTNGLRLGRESGYADTLARAGLSSVFLQFDGSDGACTALRGRPLLADKLAAVTACERAGLGVVLVPTLARGVNDAECGDIIRLALRLGPIVRGVHFQPMAAFGRHPGISGERSLHGPTLPEVLSALEYQTGGLVRMHDFHPPGCEHSLCSFSGTFVRQGKGLSPVAKAFGCCEPAAAVPASAPGTDAPTALEGALKSRAFSARQWSAPEAPTAQSIPGTTADDFDRFLAEAGTRNRFSISCMAFQDAWTIDLERVRGCCIHVLAPDCALVPFCLYNLTSARGRPLHRGRHGSAF